MTSVSIYFTPNKSRIEHVAKARQSIQSWIFFKDLIGCVHFLLLKAFTTEFRVHWGQHPLRPEFAESTYYLYKVTRETNHVSGRTTLQTGVFPKTAPPFLPLFQATGDPYYLRVGQSIAEKLNAHARVPCGFAAVHDVRTGTHEDR